MLIALKDEGKVYLAYNLRGLPLEDFDGEDYILEDNVPIWKVKNGCIMGFADDPDEADFIRYDKGLFRGEINIYNLLENILPAMLEKLDYYHKLDKERNLANDYIIAQGGSAYYIYGAGEIEELEDYFCIGKGSNAAKSSLDLTSGQSAAERIKRAYETVEASQNIPAYPIALMDTKDQKLEIIRKE